MPTTGRCNCSGITVTVDEMPSESAICYCSNCRRSGSSLCSPIFFLDRSAVEITDPNGLLKAYNDNDTTSGGTVYRSFCSNCGSPVYSAKEPNPTKIILKAGLFDETPAPGRVFFDEKRAMWLSVAKAGS